MRLVEKWCARGRVRGISKRAVLYSMKRRLERELVVS